MLFDGRDVTLGADPGVLSDGLATASAASMAVAGEAGGTGGVFAATVSDGLASAGAAVVQPDGEQLVAPPL